jgi:hypothetical protein
MRKNTKVSIEELYEPDSYDQIDEVNYHDLLPFLLNYIKPCSSAMWIFYGLNVLFLAITLCLFVANLVYSHISFWSLLNYFGLASLLTIGLIPFHELLHGLAFKILGAGKLTFGANLRYFMFYVTSHRFILSKRQFYFLALVPFVVISGICIYFLFTQSYTIRWVVANVLFAHATCCVGDFALISYFQINCRYRNGYTFDDVPSMTSYFFIKKSN